MRLTLLLIFLISVPSYSNSKPTKNPEREQALALLKKAIDSTSAKTPTFDTLLYIDQALEIKFTDSELRADLKEFKRRMIAHFDKDYRFFAEAGEQALADGRLEEAREVCKELALKIPSYPPALECLYKVKQAFLKDVENERRAMYFPTR